MRFPKAGSEKEALIRRVESATRLRNHLYFWQFHTWLQNGGAWSSMANADRTQEKTEIVVKRHPLRPKVAFRLLQGETALVTGAAQGVGKGIVLELARAGCVVGVNYLADFHRAADTVLGRRRHRAGE